MADESDAPVSEEKDLGGISRDGNPGEIDLQPEEFVFDVTVKSDDAQSD